MDEETELRVAKILGDFAAKLEEARALVQSYLEFSCNSLAELAVDFQYMLVEARVRKSPEVARALGEQGLSQENVMMVDDLVGGRAVVVSPSDIRTLVDHIRQDQKCPLQDLHVENIDDDSGYRAVHLKGRVRSGSMQLGCEIQIRTAIAHAWAVVSRGGLYRRDLAEILPKMAKTQARVLAAADDALELVREEARKAAATQPEATDRRDESPAPQVLTPEPVRLEVRVPEPSVVQAPPEAEVFVQENPISRRLVDAFYESFLEDRRKAAATELLFRRAAAFTRSDDWNDGCAAGLNALIYKGPFVEGSNWLPYRTWQFAVAIERHLLNRFERLLVQNAHPSDGVELSWPAILKKVGELRLELRDRGYTPSAIVIAGQLEVDLMVDLPRHAIPRWELSEELQAPWIEGMYQDSPIFNIREAPPPQTLYVADLQAFAKLTKYRPDAKYSADEIDEGRAREILKRDPDAVSISEGRPATLEERLRLLQLMVWLRLYESCGIELIDSGATLQTRLMNDQ
jgi:ppGpp synthetase/RelA/SpoT-type nucleotidyltranferase